MLKKIWNEPITWGSYLKLAGAAVGIYSIVMGIYLAEIYDLKEKIMAKFKKEPNVETYED